MPAIGNNDGFSASTVRHINKQAFGSAILNCALGRSGVRGGDRDNPVHRQHIVKSDVDQFNSHFFTSE